ncbi:MAG: DUF4145 domain-containing protein [Aestuariivirga sp.]
MATIKHQCPHCMVQDIALLAAAWSDVSQLKAVGHLLCPRCSKPSAVIIELTGNQNVNGFQLGNFGGDPTMVGWKIANFWPEAPKSEAPDFLPPDVERTYLQAESNFQMVGNEEAAGMMYRKALDVGLKKIDQTLNGTLGNKIKALTKAGKLTQDIENWAGHVRDLGNDAAHEEAAITRADLIDLRSFSEMTLRYLFTLPNMVRKRRGEKLPWENEVEVKT